MKRNLAKFRLTFQIVTEDSAIHGVFAYHGFLTRNGEMPRRNRGYLPKNPARFTLRDAMEILNRHDDGREPREADSFPCAVPRWFNVNAYDGEESITLAMHLDCVTPSTAARIARLAGVRLSR